MDNLEERVGGGDFVMVDGTVVGKHKGYPFYTIGQRKGLEIALGRPIYVVEINAKTNTVYLGDEEHLQRRGMIVHNVNLQKYGEVKDGIEVVTKIRYKDAGAFSTMYAGENGEVKTVFNHGVMAIAPGQSAVWYEGDDVLGGGNILKSFEV